MESPRHIAAWPTAIGQFVAEYDRPPPHCVFRSTARRLTAHGVSTPRATGNRVHDIYV
jgi:hypothetical protein